MRKIKSVLLITAMALSLTACGSSRTESANSMTYSDSVSSNSAKSAGVGLRDTYDYEGAVADESYDDVAYEEAVEESSSVSDTSQKEAKDNKLDTEKLIYRCNISLETKSFKEDVAAFQELVDKYDGFVESENTSTRNSTYAYDGANSTGLGQYVATVRVPSDKYKAFVNDAGALGTLRNKSQNVTNVSQEYSDLSIELDVLEAQRDDYMEMLKEAKKLEDMDNVILISDKIATVNTDINQLKSRLNSIDNDVAYSYIDIDIQEVREVIEYSDDTFGDRFMKEVKQGWYDFGYGMQNFLIWLVANIWGLLLFVGIICLIIFIIKKIIKRIKRKSEAKKAAKMAQMMAPQGAPYPGNPPYQGQAVTQAGVPNPANVNPGAAPNAAGNQAKTNAPGKASEQPQNTAPSADATSSSDQKNTNKNKKQK